MLLAKTHRVAVQPSQLQSSTTRTEHWCDVLQAEHAALQAGSHDQAATAAEQLQSQLSEQQRAAQTLRQDMAAMQLQLIEEGAASRGMEQQRASLEQQLASERASRQQVEHENASLQQQLASERSSRAQLQEQMNTRLSELAGAESQLAAAQAAQAELQALLGTARVGQADLQAQLNAAKAAQAELQSRLRAAQARQRQGGDANPGDGQAATTGDTASVQRPEPGSAQDLLAQIVTLQAQVRGGSTCQINLTPLAATCRQPDCRGIWLTATWPCSLLKPCSLASTLLP